MLDLLQRKKNNTVPFRKIQPVDSIENGCIYLKSGYIVHGLELSLPGLFYLSEEEVNERILAVLREFCTSLPAGAVIHIQQVFEEHPLAIRSDYASYLDHSTERHFNSKSGKRHRCFLFIGYKRQYSAREYVCDALTSFKRMEQKNYSIHMEDFSIEEYETTTRRLHDQFNQQKYIKSVFMDDAALVNYCNAYVSLSFFAPPQQGQIKEESNALAIGNRLVSFVALHENPDAEVHPYGYPRFTTDFTKQTGKEYNLPASQLHMLNLGLECPHATNVFFVVHDNASFIKQINKLSNTIKKYGKDFDQNATKVSYLNEFIEYIESNPRERIVTYGINLMLWADSHTALKTSLSLVQDAFLALKYKCIVENFQNMNYFTGNLCGNVHTIARQHLATLTGVVNFFSYESHGLLSEKGMIVSTLTGHPTKINVIDKSFPVESGQVVTKRAYNMQIYGTTGSGKSNFIAYLVHHLYFMKGHIVLLDKGNSFGKLAALFQARVLGYSKEKPLAFNPFLMSRDGEGKFVYEKTEDKFLTPLLLASLEDTLSKSEVSLLQTALNEVILPSYYERVNAGEIKSVGFNSFFEFFNGYISGEHAKKIDQALASNINFEKVLIQFVKFSKGGIYEHLFNADDNINIKNDRFVLFELDEISDDPFLYRIVTVCISIIVNKKFKDSDLELYPKRFIIDESTFVFNEFMGEVIAGLVQTGRKHYGGVIICDQTPDKIISVGGQELANRINGNTDHFIILEQKLTQSNIDYLRKYMGFTEKGIRMVQAIDNTGNFRSGVNKINEFFIPFRLELSKEYFLALNTDKENPVNKRMMTLFKELGNFEYAIEQVKEEMSA